MLENGKMNDSASGGRSILSCVFVLLWLFLLFVFPILLFYFKLHYLWAVACLAVVAGVSIIVSRGR